MCLCVYFFLIKNILLRNINRDFSLPLSVSFSPLEPLDRTGSALFFSPASIVDGEKKSHVRTSSDLQSYDSEASRTASSLNLGRFRVWLPQCLGEELEFLTLDI